MSAAKLSPLTLLAILLLIALTQVACFTGEIPNATAVWVEPTEAAPVETIAPTTLPTESAPATPEATPTSADTQRLTGFWAGEAQWLCDENPLWTVILEFKPDGRVLAQISSQFSSDTVNGTWSLNGDNLEIQFPGNPWFGTLQGERLNGSFGDETCSGVWSATRQ